jgi:hypothetical protein
MESAVGRHVVELRWRLATIEEDIEEDKELVICWNSRQTLPAAPLPSSPSDLTVQ